MPGLSLVQVEGWTLAAGGFEDGCPRVRDLELAEHLEYERPRKVRDLIARLISEGKFNGSEVCTTVGQTSAAGGRPSTEYWLTEAQALKISAKSETPKADAILDELIRVFLLLRDGALPAPRRLPETVADTVLRHKGAVEILLMGGDLIAPEVKERFIVHSAALVQGTAPTPAAVPLLDTSEYLAKRSLARDEIRKHGGQFGKRVKQLYEAKHGRPPLKVRRFINGAEREVNSYTERDRPLFDAAFDSVVKPKLTGAKVIPLKGKEGA
jgi:hypothetical protein